MVHRIFKRILVVGQGCCGEHNSVSAVPDPFLLLDFGPEQQNPTICVIFDLWVNFAESIKYI